MNQKLTSYVPIGFRLYVQKPAILQGMLNHTQITNTVSFYVKSDSHSRTKSCLYTIEF